MRAGSKEQIDLVIQKVGEKIEIGEINEILGDIIGSYDT